MSLSNKSEPSGEQPTEVASHFIFLSTTPIVRVLFLVLSVLILADVVALFVKFQLGHDYSFGLVPLFDLDGEENIPTFFSELLLIFSGALLAVIAILNRKKQAPHVSKWVTLSIGFFYMAYDEAFQVHEKLIVPFRRLLGNRRLGIFYYSWVLAGLAIVPILGLFFLKFLWHLPAVTRFRFVLAGTVYIAGAIGFELLGGRYAEIYSERNLTYNIFPAFEESLEMAGIILFIWALLTYIDDNYNEVRFRFRSQN
jgi:hypothetical protein